MSEFKGTSGQWELTNRKRGVEVNIKPSVYKQICTSSGNTKWQYDMLLISKAPKMLEMLIELKDTLADGRTFGYNDYDRLEKLIKEATELK